jgi:nucleoside-diphosphate-sugar epimerase
MNPRKYQEAIEPTNRLREVTAPYFLDAARAAGARRAIFQSISFVTAPGGEWVHDESAPVSDEQWSSLRLMERAVVGAEGLDGVVLRYGTFYGPGTWNGPGGWIAEDIRRRRFPIVGAGTAYTSFVHVDDAAGATVRALDHGGSGIYNVCDDEPAPATTWVPALAAQLGAKPPRHVPLWVAKLAAGPVAETMGLRQRGNSNAKAKRELDWTPRYPSWREGFAAVF